MEKAYREMKRIYKVLTDKQRHEELSDMELGELLLIQSLIGMIEDRNEI